MATKDNNILRLEDIQVGSPIPKISRKLNDNMSTNLKSTADNTPNERPLLNAKFHS